MNRIRITAGLLTTLVLSGYAAFNDDFSNEQVSNTNWTKNSDALTVQFASGACKIVNSDTGFMGFARHAFSENARPSTFTLSGKITLDNATMSAGFACCVASSGMATGYYISIVENSLVAIHKMGSSGSSTVLGVEKSTFLTSGANELKISRKDGVFNIFCNGRFTATFTDNDFSAGDIGLLVAPKTTAVFDDIVMTDTFDTASVPTCFADDFSNSALLGWDWFGTDYENASLHAENGVLHITTGALQNVYQVFDMPLTNFIMRVVVSHRGLSSQNFYGLFVCDGGTSTISVAGFGINGDSRYGVGVFRPEDPIVPVPSTSIRGDRYVSSTGDTTYYLDTLEVMKREGEDAYLFIVNKDTLSRLTGVDFAVAGAGIFCFDSIDVRFDDFLVANGTEAVCHVEIPVTLRTRHPAALDIVKSDLRFFDLSGRVAAKNGMQLRSGAAPGLYIGRSGAVRDCRVNRR
jgi:hypothetical protein